MAGLSPLIGPSPSPSPSPTIEPDAVPRSRRNAPTPTSAPDRIETSTAQSPIDQLRRHAESVVSGTENAAASAAASTIHAVESAGSATGDAAQSVARNMNDGLKSAASATRSFASGAASRLNELGHVARIVAKDLVPNPAVSIIRMAAEPLPAGELQGASIDTPQSRFTSSRAAALKTQLGRASGFGTTMAVATGTDKYGKEVKLVSTSDLQADGKPNLRKSVRPLGLDETPVGGDPKAHNSDAETNIARYAKANHITLTDIAVTRPVGICSDCESELTAQSPDIHFSSPLTGQPPRSRR